MYDALKKYNAGLRLKTTWTMLLEELVSLAEAGGKLNIPIG